MLRLFKCLPGPAFTALAFATLAAAQTQQPTQNTLTAAAPVRCRDPPRRHPARGRRRRRHRQEPEARSRPQSLGLHPHRRERPAGRQALRRTHALTPADATKSPIHAQVSSGRLHQLHPPPVNGAVNLLLLDTLNTPLKRPGLRPPAALAYLNAAPPGTRIAIFGLTTQLTILQGFTSDPECSRPSRHESPEKFPSAPGFGRRRRHRTA